MESLGVTFQPSTLTFEAGSKGANFSVTASPYIEPSTQLRQVFLTLSGPASSMYTVEDTTVSIVVAEGVAVRYGTGCTVYGEVVDGQEVDIIFGALVASVAVLAVALLVVLTLCMTQRRQHRKVHDEYSRRDSVKKQLTGLPGTPLVRGGTKRQVTVRVAEGKEEVGEVQAKLTIERKDHETTSARVHEMTLVNERLRLQLKDKGDRIAELRGTNKNLEMHLNELISKAPDGGKRVKHTQSLKQVQSRATGSFVVDMAEKRKPRLADRHSSHHNSNANTPTRSPERGSQNKPVSGRASWTGAGVEVPQLSLQVGELKDSSQGRDGPRGSQGRDSPRGSQRHEQDGQSKRRRDAVPPLITDKKFAQEWLRKTVGFLGLAVDDNKGGREGVVIVDVEESMAQHQGGLQKGCVLLSLNGQRLRSHGDFKIVANGLRVGTRVPFVCHRRDDSGKKRTGELLVGARDMTPSQVEGIVWCAEGSDS
jgi:hypothetical protein